MGVVLSMVTSSAAMASEYLECKPLPHKGARQNAGSLNFDEDGRWSLVDGGVRIKGTLKTNPSGIKGFAVVTNRISDGAAQFIYYFFDSKCDSEGMGAAKLYYKNGDQTILLNSYACKCAVD